MRLNVLQRLWHRPEEFEPELAASKPQVLTLAEVVKDRPTPVSEAAVLNPVPASRPKAMLSPSRRKPRRRRKQYRLSSLRGREHVTPAQKQAAALLYQIADACPQLVGTWIRKDELRDWYFELAAQEGWQAQSWIRVAKALKEWTASRRITRNDEKLTCYKVVAISKPLKRRAAQLSRPSNAVATIGDPAPGATA